MPTKPRRTTSARPPKGDKLDYLILQNDLILEKQNSLNLTVQLMEKNMSAELDAVKAAVQKNTDAELAAADLLRRLSQLITDSINDKPALQQLAADVNAQADALAAAVTANTPAA
jgi:hypothetical protein